MPPSDLKKRIDFETELVRDLIGPFDFLIVSEEEFKNMRNSGIYAEIYAKHRVLYDNGFFKKNLKKPEMVKVGEGLWMKAKR